MKKSFLLLLLVVGVFLISCDEPQPLDDSGFSYNPFTFKKDTLQNVLNMTSGKSTIDWGSNLRAWVGETKYYKSGIEVEFQFPDTSLDLSTADSIKLHVRHSMSFHENGGDTLMSQMSALGFYETTDQTIDLSGSNYGTWLAVDSVDVKTENLYWTFKLPAGTITTSDSTIALGLFPDESGLLSSIYGGGSTISPSLLFYFHEPDSAGLDSVTAITVQSDTLHQYLIEQTAAFDHSKYLYLSQLTEDSLVIGLDMNSLLPQDDTLTHVVDSRLLLGVDHAASAFYVSGSEDSLTTYYLRVFDYDAGLFSSLTLTEGEDLSNDIGHIIQSAINGGTDQIELVVKSNHTGYDPGFMAIDTSLTSNAIYVHTSQVVRP